MATLTDKSTAITPSGTHLPVKADPKQIAAAIAAANDKKISNCFRVLHEKFKERTGCSPSDLDDVYEAVRKFLANHEILDEHTVFDAWRRTPVGRPENPEIVFVKQQIGWMLAFGGNGKLFPSTTRGIATALNLLPNHNPWPELYRASILDGPKESVHQPMPEREPESGPDPDYEFSLLPTLAAFREYLGSLSGHHFLIMEGAGVDGGPAIFQILLGASRHARAQGVDSNGLILDLTGAPYIGLETDRRAVFQAGELPEGAKATDKQAWFLPQMEAVWRATEVMNYRIKQKQHQARQGEPCDFFSPFYFVLRRWNVVLKDWTRISKDKEFMGELLKRWREVYDHGPDDTVNIEQDVERIQDLGDAVNMILVQTISSLSKLESLGKTKSELNSMVVIIVGDATVSLGCQSIRTALSDARLSFSEADGKKELRDMVDTGVRYSAATGHQIALINSAPAGKQSEATTGKKKGLVDLAPPTVMIIETWQVDEYGDRVSITGYKSKALEGFNCAGLLQAQASSLALSNPGRGDYPKPAQ